MPATTKTGHRPLREIAQDVEANWTNVKYSARPYLNAMHDMEDIGDMYGHEYGDMIVLYFLSNATGWRGDHAKRIKAELKRAVELYNQGRGR